MILKRMKGTFGTLDGASLQLGEGLNIIYAPNESGKSTWCAFLRAMLYGIDTSQRAKGGRLPDKTKYAPWSGALMEGELELEHAGKSITLRRSSPSAGAPMREFSAVYTGTDIPVPGMTATDAGEQLTGVSADVFSRSAFIGQGGVAVTGTPELEKRISSIVTSGEEESSYTEADACLRAWQRKRRSGRKGVIPELEQTIAETESRLARLQSSVQERMLLTQELEQTQKELDRLSLQITEARKRERRQALASVGEGKTRLHALEQRLEQAERKASEKEEALARTHFGALPPETARGTAEADAARAGALGQQAVQTKKPFLWIAPLLLAVLAVLLGVMVTPVFYYAAGGLAAAAAVLFLVVRSGNRRAEAAGAALRELLRSYGTADADGILEAAEVHAAACAAHQAAAEEARRAAGALEAERAEQSRRNERLVQDLDFEHGTGEASQLQQRKNATEQLAARLRTQLDRLTGAALAIGDPMALESELQTLQTRRAELTAQYDAITLAVAAMARADAEIQTRFSPQLAQKAAEDLAFLTDGRYDALVLARDFSAKVRPAGELTPRETGYLSAGAVDLLYLSVRLAMCELALESDEPCPIVLDDTIVNFDDERAKRALELFRRIAERRQVILFTCHRRDFPDGAATQTH